MLESFYIRNYRLFQELKINSLRRVNLIIGKNNVGKSSLQEAICTYLYKDQIADSIYSTSYYRGEWIGNDFAPLKIQKSIMAMYNRNVILNQRSNAIYIGSDEQIGISFYLGNTDNRKTQPALIVEDNQKSVQSIPLSNFQSYLSSSLVEKHNIVASSSPSDFINTLSSSWSEIALTDKEDYVVEALQVIDKNIERLTFIKDDTFSTEKAIVKLRNISKPVSLGSMGDGVVKILRAVINLVRCENGTLLIDEFENGLHWSVQVELWKIIYRLAEKLNVQIFATTHSQDTIWALHKAALSEKREKDTRVVKLKLTKKQMIKAVELDVEDIEAALDQGFEIR
ncbi:MAG: AAA family ATPase [Desulfobacteraceae bacterium]|nr:AAA family ATPase [Desulfobacteraceae bacterium]